MDSGQILCETCGAFYHTLFYTEHIASMEHCHVFQNFFTETESAAQCRLVTLTVGNQNNIFGVEEYLEHFRNNVCYWLKHYQNLHNSIKYNMVLECKFYKDEEFQLRSFKTCNAVVYKLTDINEQYSRDVQKILNEKHDLEQRGSGWSLFSVERLELRINKYEPITGGANLSRIKIPSYLKNKKCIVNPYKFISGKKPPLNCCNNLCFKFSILGKPLFDLGINVHILRNYYKYIYVNNTYNWDCVKFPVDIESVNVFEEHNDISINVYGIDKCNKKVYPLKVAKSRKKDHRDILYFKNHYCWIKNFERLVTSQVLSKKRVHLYVCRLCFKRFYKKELLIDHEKNCCCSLTGLTTFQSPKSGKDVVLFKNYNRQLKIPFVIYADINMVFKKVNSCSPDPNSSYTHSLGSYEAKTFTYCVVFNGTLQNVKKFTNIKCFIDSIENESKQIYETYKVNVPIQGKVLDKPKFNDLCHICEKPLKNDYVLDHEHTNGLVRGYAHSSCNINFRLPTFVPIIMKNLTKLHSSLILEYFLKDCAKKTTLSVIPCNENLNKFTSLSYKVSRIRIKFIDQSKFVELDDNLDFLTTLCMFERARTICHEHYKLDLAYYMSIGAFSWDAMLKNTNVTLELLNDVDMYNMVRMGIRGGLVQCVKRYARANNTNNPSTYVPSIPPSYIYYFDIINLYGKIMQDYPLPHCEFSWVKDVNKINLKDIKGNIGYIFEVDLEYPKELKYSHSDFPLCPHNIEGRGLVATLKNKYNYVIHHVALCQAIEMGLVLKKIHRAIQFKESTWMSSYISLNTKLREKYFNEKYLSNMFKLQSNIIYGKSIEKVENRLNVNILKSNIKKLMKLIKQPTFVDRKIVDENTYVVYTQKLKCKITKPITMGMSILDISKSYIYDLYYNHLKTHLPNFDLLYTDTDALLVQIFNDGDVTKYLRDCPDVFYLHEGLGPIGKFRDQSHKNPILEYVGLRCKVYGYRCENSLTLKNLPRGLDFNYYVQLLESENKEKTMNHYKRVVGNTIHELCVNKNLPTVGEDRKRIICPDRIHTLPLV